MSTGTELDRIALLLATFGDGGVRLGIGDDAAVVDVPACSLVWTIDAAVEGTHFRRAWLSWEDVGWRSFMAAASDLAAMGAEPIAALSALVLADDVDDDALAALAQGQRAAAAEVGAPVVGGNLARGRETSITTTVLGRAARPITRAGAREGDLVVVAGPLGHAAAGLAALVAGSMDDATIAAWRRPRARIDAGRALAPGGATSAIDVSDGLARDASHLADASGVRIVLDEAALLASGVALDHVLFGGEDYALLATAPSTIAGFTPIGEVARGAGVALRRRDGSVVPVPPRGFDHFGA